jgi:dTDP-glucose 4,6-dehydratase
MWKIELDLAHVLAAPPIRWDELRHARLLLTGGTGFIGRWLLETLQQANDRLALDLHITVPSRQPDTFRQRAGHLLANGKLTLIPLDLAVEKPEGDFTHIVHAATDTSAKLNEEQPLKVFQTIVHCTDEVLELAASHPGVKVLFLSSGAVYGQQPPELAGIPESWYGSPDPQLPRNAYGEAKRAAEMLCAIYRKQFGVDVVTARIFSLLGPFLPLDTHFAAGNFIRDAMAGQEITVHGNGQPIRSYLYPTDLSIWLLTLLTRKCKETAYNIGSERTISIGELARITSELLGSGLYRILGAEDSGWNTGRYVPNTKLIRDEFELTESVTLETALLNTAASVRLGYNSKPAGLL